MTRLHKLLIVLLAVGLVGIVSGMGSYSLFNSSTSNSANGFQAGTVNLTDNDGGNAMLSLSSAMPGTSDTSCIAVTFSGSLSSTVRLYATVSGNLAQYLTLTVTRGTDSSPSFDSCTNFTADSTNYIGQGAGVIYSGALNAYPASYAAGLVDPTSSSPETWSTNEAHSYKFVITLPNGVSQNAESQSATTTFTWEAQNL